MKYILIPFAAIVAYLAPVAPLVHALLFFMAADWITGVYKAKKLKQKITSKGFRNTAEKFVSYTAAIILGHVFGQQIAELHLTRLVAGYLALTELKSIYENLAAITGNDILLNIYLQIETAVKNKLTPNKKPEP